MARAQNKFVKHANTETEYTPQNLIDLKRCAADPVFFIKNFVKIQHPTRGAIPFDLYDYQEDLINSFKSHNNNIILSARQTGKCQLGTSQLTVITTGHKIKQFILYLLDNTQHDQIYNKRS